jgi:hypothetical protein
MDDWRKIAITLIDPARGGFECNRLVATVEDFLVFVCDHSSDEQELIKVHNTRASEKDGAVRSLCPDQEAIPRNVQLSTQD